MHSPSIIVNFLIGVAIVAACVLAWSAAQGLGVAFGHGVQEWLVR